MCQSEQLTRNTNESEREAQAIVHVVQGNVLPCAAAAAAAFETNSARELMKLSL